jgi:hypothetical protein
MHSVAEKIGTCSGILGQEFAEPSTSLASITCPASGHQVPTRLITPVSPRLNVVDCEFGRFKYTPAIDTPPAISSKDVKTVHESGPYEDCLILRCGPIS